MLKKIDYQKELNPAQLAAVQATDGQYLVIAGAGSGKTRTLVYRVARLVESGVKPDEILLLTFTRRAAEEMLRRAALLLDERCQRISGGTFHSFANAVLRKYAGVLGFSNNFTILDRADSEDAIQLIRAQLGFSKLDKRFPRKGAIAETISMSVNKGLALEDVFYEEYPHFMEWVDQVKRISREYRKYKQANSLLDYDDLLVYLKNLLEKHSSAALSLANKYRYIMVDEYQDTNKLQAQIACLLASEHKNIMVVGDDSQSIYSFRGANFKNIMDFPKIFKAAKVITLEENYRSTQPILNMTNQVIRFAREKFEKNLYTKKIGGKPPVFIDASDEHGQSTYIADKILELNNQGIGLSEMAVLFRSGWHSNDLEIELASRNISFAKYGGQKFVEAAHIKDILAYLRVAYNPLNRLSWQRALLLMRKVGPKTAERVMAQMIQNEAGLAVDPKLSERIADLKELLELLNDFGKQKYSPAEMIKIFLKYYQPLLKEKYDDFHKRLADLDSLGRIAGRYKTLEQFLTDMALEPPEKNILEAASLTLSTIHSAKGLEWKVVFLIYVAEGHLPSYLSLEDQEAIEEERRLFYVAVTRAKENLFLLKPRVDFSPRSYFQSGASGFTRISRFLEEGEILNKFVEYKNDAGGSTGGVSLDEMISSTL